MLIMGLILPKAIQVIEEQKYGFTVLMKSTIHRMANNVSLLHFTSP